MYPALMERLDDVIGNRHVPPRRRFVFWTRLECHKAPKMLLFGAIFTQTLSGPRSGLESKKLLNNAKPHSLNALKIIINCGAKLIAIW